MFRVARFHTVRTDGTTHTWYEVRCVSPVEAQRDRIEIDNRTVFPSWDQAQRTAMAKNREPEQDATPPVFKAGSVVRLKSGGPDMTIEKVGEKTQTSWPIWVAWFPGQDEYGAWRSALTTSFQAESLEFSGAE